MEEEIINSYLTFRVNGGTYGVHVSRVVEILAYDAPKAKAGDVDFILGLIEHRGQVVPLIDSGKKFDVGSTKLTEQTYVIVIEVEDKGGKFDVALAVDEVSEVMEITEETKKEIETSYKPGYIDFAAEISGGLALIINPDKVFTDSEVVSMSKFIGGVKETK
jgi:chemotaxis signal transduction protein